MDDYAVLSWWEVTGFLPHMLLHNLMPAALKASPVPCDTYKGPLVGALADHVHWPLVGNTRGSGLAHVRKDGRLHYHLLFPDLFLLRLARFTHAILERRRIGVLIIDRTQRIPRIPKRPREDDSESSA